MDLSLLHKDDQSRPAPAPADGRTGDSKLSLLDSPNEDTRCAHETGTRMLSESPNAFPDVSNPLPQDHGTDCLSTSYNMSECFSAVKEDEFKVCDCFGSSLPLLPHLPQDLISPRPECFSETYTRGTGTAQSPGAMASVSEDLMASSIAELLFNHGSISEHSQSSLLTWPLSPQSETLERDTVIVPVSELFIFESDTQDFIQKPVAPQEIKCPECQPFSQTGGEKECSDSMYDSAGVAMPYHRDYMANDESGMIHTTRLGPPAVDTQDVGLVSGSDASQRKAEVTGLSPHLGRSDSPAEVWQDACQYLAGEDIKDQDVLDKRGHSVMQGVLSATGDASFLPGKTQVSLHNPHVSDCIGWSSEKPRRPPVERWSSVDSWASALSDWTEIITAAPEDITAAFTEIGAEIEALTQALAEVDTPEGIQSSQAESSQCPTYQHSTMGSATGASYDVTPTLSPRSTGSQGISQFDAYVTSLDMDIFTTNGTDPIILNIIEDTDLVGQHAPAETLKIEPLGDGRCEVTHGHSVSQRGFGSEQEAQRRWGPVVVNAGGTESSPDGLFLTTDSLTLSSVDLQASLHIDTSPDTLANLDGARQVEPQSRGPEFIAPLAPLSISSSLICQATDNLAGDQLCPERFLNDKRVLGCDPIQPCVLWPASDGITDKASLEGDVELIHKKDNTVESSQEGQCKHSLDTSLSFLTEQKVTKDIHELSRELLNLAPVPADHFIVSEEKHIACITLEINDPLFFWSPKPIKTDLELEADQETAEEMPHKSHKNTESKTRGKKDKAGSHHHGPQVAKKPEAPHVSAQHSCNKQEPRPHTGENRRGEDTPTGLEDSETKLVIEPDTAAETAPSKAHAKKKKKQGQNAAAVRSAPPADVESGVKPKSAKGRIEMFEAKLAVTAGTAGKESDQTDVTGLKTQQPENKALQGQRLPDVMDQKGCQAKSCTSSLKDDMVKRRRLSGDKFGKIVSVLESKIPKTDVSMKAKGDETKIEAGATRKKAYSEVVKQKIPPKEELKVVQPIQAAAVSGDAQSLCLWAQFACVFSDHTVTWSREGKVLAEVRRSAGDESRVSVTVSSASHKDLGKYQCHLSSLHGSITLDYLLTYEVLSEIVIPPSPKAITPALAQVGSEEEDVHCSSLMFKEDFLSDQYFGENHPVSIVTEKAHFGEGMHRRAFRTKLQAGQIPLLVAGHSCVLKVHNSLSYGTKNNDELIQKNFSLAVEECQVQNTAREYIREYTAVAQSTDTFGDVPEIIPIYLIHRPSNDIPYATLEEELLGNFVKYSVKDGKEINLMRRDSEAGQKCCAFQHWVYEKTEGNLLVTDMQGVGMRLTDVGIATCKKGYKGFKGNCATSFIDQFKALHQCNRYCEILELKSLQPKAKKPASAPKPKPPASAAPKKKMSGPTVRGKT